MGMVAEGVNTTKVVHELSKNITLKCQFPILFMKSYLKEETLKSVKDLMIRRLKKERLQE